jgi:hypothetical protein
MRVMPGIEISTFGRISLENVKGEFEANPATVTSALEER